MIKAQDSGINKNVSDNDLLPEYHFDYRKARPNRFAAMFPKDHLIVALDPDVAAVFSDAEEANRALRALIEAMPKAVR